MASSNIDLINADDNPYNWNEVSLDVCTTVSHCIMRKKNEWQMKP